MSTIIIGGGDGKHAVTKLVNSYSHMAPEEKGAAVALLQQFIEDVNSLCAGIEHDGQQDEDQQ
jgi:hypothetical protein